MKRESILRNKSEIDNLFANGKYISNELIMFKILDSDSTKFLFCVSCKKFKRAVDRNRIKRLMKESVKNISINNKSIAIVFRGDVVPSFLDMNNGINELITKL